MLIGCCSLTGVAQTIPAKLAAAYKAFAQDQQLRYAIASLYVAEAETGEVVFSENAAIGLVPASTLKVVTAASAYELLGRDFRYKTSFALAKQADGASLLVLPSGDPTLGSWRWNNTREEGVLQGVAQAIRRQNVSNIKRLVVDNRGWNAELIPDGWIWQDIGNYYGAGPAKLNWRENQFDVYLTSGSRIGDPVSVVGTKPSISGYKLRSELSSAAAGSGDQAYIYFPLQDQVGTIRGTIPVNQSRFKISGALPDASAQFVTQLQGVLQESKIQSTGMAIVAAEANSDLDKYSLMHTVTSPPLDSIIYWFNQKSINLYGEALVKTIAFQKTGTGATRQGMETIQEFWAKQGIQAAELNVLDGSGLSPLNRITTRAQTAVLLYARKQPWYSGFYASLPVYNGMKMKSGTMQGVKGFTGYHKAPNGKVYAFSFLVNNYAGSSGALVPKMYKVLDALK